MGGNAVIFGTKPVGATADRVLTDGQGRLQVSLGGGSSGLPEQPVAANPSINAGTNRSGTATTVSGGLTVPANANRKLLVGQNVSAVDIGFNEFGGAAAIGSPGTYTVPPRESFSISTTNAVNFIAASATAAVTMTEIS